MNESGKHGREMFSMSLESYPVPGSTSEFPGYVSLLFGGGCRDTMDSTPE